MVLKYFLRSFVICMSVFTTNANAIPSYVYNGNGDITGVTALEINSTLWDMTLHDGSYDSLFDTFGSNALYTDTFSEAASDALNVMTTTLPIAAGALFGCATLATDCHIATAFQYDQLNHTVTATSDLVRDAFPDGLQSGTVDSRLDFNVLTYATWTVHGVPEPSVALLLASGLVVFRVTRRKVRI